MLTNEK